MKNIAIILVIIFLVSSCSNAYSIDVFESETFDETVEGFVSSEQATNDQDDASVFLNSELDSEEENADINVCDDSNVLLLHKKILELQDMVRQTDSTYSIVTKELELARQIIGELNIKLATRDSELASLKQSHVSYNNSTQKNSTVNMNIEELLLASIEESTQYIKELSGKLEDSAVITNQCIEEKSALTKELGVMDLKSRIAKNEQNLARLSRDQCLLEMELLRGEADTLSSSECLQKSCNATESKSCDIIHCLKSISARDIQDTIVGAYESAVTNGAFPLLVRWRHLTIEFFTTQIDRFQLEGYPYICRCFQLSWHHIYRYVSSAIVICRYAWTTHIFPFFAFSLQPKIASFYSANIDPFVTNKVIPLYKLHLEKSIDSAIRFSSEFYYNHLETLVIDYLEPAFDWIAGKAHYAVYFTIKYFEQDDWMDVSISLFQNAVHTTLENIAGFYLVQSVCGAAHSAQCANAIVNIALLLVALLFRTFFLGLAAGVLILLLSPLLAVLYILSKLVLFLLPPAKSITPSKDKSQSEISTSTLRESGHEKPRSVAVRREDPPVVARRSNDSFNGDSSHPHAPSPQQQYITRRIPVSQPRRTQQQQYHHQQQKQQQQQYQGYPSSLSMPSPARLDVNNDFMSSNNTSLTSHSPPNSKLSTPDIKVPSSSRSPSRSIFANHSYAKDESMLSTTFTTSPSKNSKLQQLRQRKSPGAVTLGLTPAAALGLVPIGMERGRSLEDEEEEVVEQEEEGDSLVYEKREELVLDDTFVGEGEEEDNLGRLHQGNDGFSIDEKDTEKDFSFADL